MVIIKMIGGLGNQMFSYAFGRSMALRRQEKLKLDLRWYDDVHAGEVPREYVMENYRIMAERASDAEIAANQPGRIYKYWDKLQRIIYPDYHIRCHEGILKSKRIYFKGFFQSYKYFEEFSETIGQELALRNELTGVAKQVEDDITHSNSVSIHIRRGDVVTNEKVNAAWGLMSMAYYERAMNYMAEKIANPKFFVFTDDPEWAEENFKLPFDIAVVSGHRFHETIDMHLMSSCRHNIIANSTFSWWGAWLNKNPRKIVIRPSQWFKIKNIHTTNDFIPSSWIGL